MRNKNESKYQKSQKNGPDSDTDREGSQGKIKQTSGDQSASKTLQQDDQEDHDDKDGEEYSDEDEIMENGGPNDFADQQNKFVNSLIQNLEIKN